MLTPMKLRDYFKKQRIRNYTRWAKDKNLDPALIYRVLKGNDIFMSSAEKISNATGGMVTIGDLAKRNK